MGIKKSEKIWHNGKFIDWDDAKIHVLSHVVHYGSSVFEGERCYETKRGPAIFRLEDHSRRFFFSCRVYRMDLPFSVDEFSQAVIETVRINNLKSCYIRPVAFRGYDSLGLNPFPCPVEVYIAAWEWGAYLGEEALREGVDVKVSSWNRMAPNTLPAMAKAGANYMNSQLIKMEALIDGYAEGIALDSSGYVSEGSAENLFLVKDGKLYTPPVYSSILEGITRNTIITLARDLGYEVVEERIPREMLYNADELFLCGTAAEITPIRSVDRIKIGAGKRGPITAELQNEFFGIVRGEKEDRYNWLTYI
ncbi:MAG: branched-chain amino acid transaminase [Acidobacteria bacterium]|nr:branched-chain amino acid transaminase [Acidobacteriota bacterium]